MNKMTFQDLKDAVNKLTPEELQEPFKSHAEGEFFTSFSIYRLSEGDTEADNWLIFDVEDMSP